MVTLKKVSRKQLPLLIALSYKDDQDLWEKFHVEKLSYEEAVKSTLQMIEEAEEMLCIEHYKVTYDSQTIGYFTKSGTLIYSFGIAMPFRTKEILTQWWDAVKELMGPKFTVGLLSNNTRAIKYMQDRGMTILWENPKKKEINEMFLTT
jgi:hypothetical protein